MSFVAVDEQSARNLIRAICVKVEQSARVYSRCECEFCLVSWEFIYGLNWIGFCLVFGNVEFKRKKDTNYLSLWGFHGYKKGIFTETKRTK